jgi:hypothetical protein
MEIRLLLEKYKNLGFSEKRIKELTLIVCGQYSLNITSDDIDIKQSEVKIKVSGAPRAHFVLIKNKFEQSLQEVLKKEGLLVTKIY